MTVKLDSISNSDEEDSHRRFLAHILELFSSRRLTKTFSPMTAKELPRLILEKDLKTGEYTVWNTVEHCEVFRGTREDAIQFTKG